jgi:2-succinyl-5-enolpyruvyl-6-hydroxy-3-cyclohexene-1-carboxylate synthase
MAPALDFRNTNTLWCSVLVETLVRCGVTQAVISPGSRSAPLIVALARHPSIACVSVIDERSAAYFALGVAKRTRRPVALLCTSGTAGANYFPAIIEAHESGTPLLVLTADRPPEMRDCASGQTIDQQKLFGSYVVFYHEFAVPEAKVEVLRYARQTIAHAVARAMNFAPGPVHLNLPFRDPLAPVEDASATAARDQIGADFFAHLQPPSRVMATSAAWQRPITTRGLIVAGPANSDNVTDYVTRVRDFAAALGWPVLADALSPLRHHGDAPDAKGVTVAHYDAILRNERTARELVPKYVICLESWPTSKTLRAWLEQSGAEILLVSPAADNRDALHGRTRVLPLPVESLTADAETARTQGPALQEYTRAWREAEAAARAKLALAFEEMPELFEGKASWMLAQHVPERTPVFVASSMPVRDAEYFWPANARGDGFFFNRGANGIDGTLSTALGIAHASDAPAVLLTGDLAFLHDANGLLLRGKVRGSLTVVLINNRGGGIFEHLPIARFDPPFEEFFATPQNVDFAKLCAAHGVEHELVRDWAHFTSLISKLPLAGIRVLELRTDRKRDAATRKRLLAQAS